MLLLLHSSFAGVDSESADTVFQGIETGALQKASNSRTKQGI